MRICPSPQTAQEPVRAFGTRVRPRCRLIGGTCEHHERPGRIGTELFDDVTRFDDVVFTLTHLFDAAGRDGLPVVVGNHARWTTFFVVLDRDFVRVIPALMTVRKVTVETLGRKHSLCKEPCKRFIELHKS